MTSILGISAFYHDSAAALIVDGKLVAAAQEERFTRKKHDPDFPTNAVEYCLSEAGLTEADLDNALIQVFYMAQEAIDQTEITRNGTVTLYR